MRDRMDTKDKNENVWDIKQKKNLNFILPRNYRYAPQESIGNCLLVIHLHYVDTLPFYMEYIKNIPEEIAIIITYAGEEMFSALDVYRQKMSRTFEMVEKENRGRDISAFLVACRERLLEYENVGFLHDKKEKCVELKQETEGFVKTLWDNLAISKEYVYNVLSTLKQNKELGVLLPPEAMGDHYQFVYSNTWDKDYELMLKLRDELKLDCNLDPDKKPISLGTAFWAKTDALRPLLAKEWKYEDFDPEPLANDGTISHAIERCFAYVAQSQGYNSGIVMNDKYAGQYINQMQDELSMSMKMLQKYWQNTYLAAIRATLRDEKTLEEYLGKKDTVYIYGAGQMGTVCAAMIKAMNSDFRAFIDSSDDKIGKECEGHPIVGIDQVMKNQNIGIIVALGQANRTEVITLLQENGWNSSDLYVMQSWK